MRVLTAAAMVVFVFLGLALAQSPEGSSDAQERILKELAEIRIILGKSGSFLLHCSRVVIAGAIIAFDILLFGFYIPQSRYE